VRSRTATHLLYQPAPHNDGICIYEDVAISPGQAAELGLRLAVELARAGGNTIVIGLLLDPGPEQISGQGKKFTALAYPALTVQGQRRKKLD